MKYLVFKRETNKFEDILKDPTVKKVYKTKIQFTGHLMLGIPDTTDSSKTISYIVLKYGDDIISMDSIIPDRSPIPYKDYNPERKTRSKRKGLTS